MYLAVSVVMLTLGGWIITAALFASSRRITFHQAFLYLPIRLLHRIDDRAFAPAKSDAPVIYAVLHQSRLDPAVMLSLLPSDTLHILDQASARSFWLEPWREMARTIAFNTAHVFVSRRLVRHLRGRGRLAVYLPDGIEPDTRPYRIYRAISRIAAAADARIVPVSLQGSRRTVFSLDFSNDQARRGLMKLKVQALEPLTLVELVSRSEREPATMTGAFYDRVIEADAA